MEEWLLSVAGVPEEWRGIGVRVVQSLYVFFGVLLIWFWHYGALRRARQVTEAATCRVIASQVREIAEALASMLENAPAVDRLRRPSDPAEAGAAARLRLVKLQIIWAVIADLRTIPETMGPGLALRRLATMHDLIEAVFGGRVRSVVDMQDAIIIPSDSAHVTDRLWCRTALVATSATIHALENASIECSRIIQDMNHATAASSSGD